MNLPASRLGVCIDPEDILRHEVARQLGPHPVLDALFGEHLSALSAPLRRHRLSPISGNSGANLTTLHGAVTTDRAHAPVRRDKRRNRLAIALVRDADHADLLHAAELEQAVLDLEWVDVLAAADD